MALRYTFRQLEYFVAAAEDGSVALAAERIKVSPPAISAAIAHLEAEFGVPLFVRQHARGMALTAKGRALRERARAILEDAAALREVVGDLDGRLRGPIRIGCLNTLAPLILAGLRRGFSYAHPGVAVTQVVGHQAALFAALRRAEIDLAITYDMDVPADLEFLPLADMRPYAMVAKDHPLALAGRATLAELAKLPMILLDLPVSRDYFLALFQEAGLKPLIAERSTDLFVVRSLVANGFGYSIANLRPLSDTAPDGMPIASVSLDGPLRALPLGLALVRALPPTRTVKAFCDHCRGMLGALDVLDERPKMLEHDPEKLLDFSEKDHAQTKT